MFIRAVVRTQDATPWQRTRPEGDGFVFGVRDGVHEARLLPNADRSVELFLAVLEHFAPAGTLRIDDWRAGTAWVGEDVATADVREAVARARHALCAHGGVEITMVSGGEQATLTPNLEVYLFAPTDRWLYLLQGKGLRRVPALRRRSWRLARGEFAPARAVTDAVRLLGERLHLGQEAAG